MKNWAVFFSAVNLEDVQILKRQAFEVKRVMYVSLNCKKVFDVMNKSRWIITVEVKPLRAVFMSQTQLTPASYCSFSFLH